METSSLPLVLSLQRTSVRLFCRHCKTLFCVLAFDANEQLREDSAARNEDDHEIVPVPTLATVLPEDETHHPF